MSMTTKERADAATLLRNMADQLDGLLAMDADVTAIALIMISSNMNDGRATCFVLDCCRPAFDKAVYKGLDVVSVTKSVIIRPSH